MALVRETVSIFLEQATFPTTECFHPDSLHFSRIDHVLSSGAKLRFSEHCLIVLSFCVWQSLRRIRGAVQLFHERLTEFPPGKCRPVMTVLHQDRQTPCCGLMGKKADDIGPPTNFPIEPFQRIGGRDLFPMFVGEAHIRENIVLGIGQEAGRLRNPSLISLNSAQTSEHSSSPLLKMLTIIESLSLYNHHKNGLITAGFTL